MIIGTGTFGFVTKKTNIPSIFLGEDDLTTNIVLLLSGLFIYRDFSAILSPKGVNNSIWNKKNYILRRLSETCISSPQSICS